jgi:hypothetical protein
MPGMPGLDEEHPANSSAVTMSARFQSSEAVDVTHIVILLQLL